MGKLTMAQRIMYWLEANPDMRGRKEKVVSSIWWNELPENLKTDEVQVVLEMIADKKLSSAETIMRSHRKVLESRDAWRSNAKFKPEPKQTVDDVIKGLGK